MIQSHKEEKATFANKGPQRYILAMTNREELLRIWNLQFV
jgi:hypothetical protein